MRVRMREKIHILGASGSGTTTLGAALSNILGCSHFDTDDFYWIKTQPPFRTPRPRPERQHLLQSALASDSSWVLSGSLCGWGDFAIPRFDLVVFLWIPQETRMRRLEARECERYGEDILNPADSRYATHRGFLEWAAAYDTGGPDMRSKARHEAWMQGLPCPVLRLEGDYSVGDSVKAVLRHANLRNNTKNLCKHR